jgi:hypothetical protein
MTAPQISTTFDPPVQTDSKTTFDSKAFAVLAALNPWSSQANALGLYLDNISEFASAYEALVNFKGAWGGLSGALAMPATVSHSGAIYALTADVADVTAHTPGVSGSWQLVRTNSAQIAHESSTVYDELASLKYNNLIVNGNFAVNQSLRTGLVVIAAGVRAHSAWKAGASGCTYTFATSGGVTTITIVSGTMVQVVDGMEISSGTHALGWSGTAQARINGGTYGASGMTATLTRGTNATVEFNTGTVSLVRMKRGAVAPPFQHLPSEDVARCEWRLPSIRSAGASNIGHGVITGTGTGTIVVSLKATPRAIPTGFSLVGGALSDLSVTTVALSAAVTGLAFLSANDGRVTLLVTWTGGPSSVGASIFLNTNAVETVFLFTGAEPT